MASCSACWTSLVSASGFCVQSYTVLRGSATSALSHSTSLGTWLLRPGKCITLGLESFGFCNVVWPPIARSKVLRTGPGFWQKLSGGKFVLSGLFSQLATCLTSPSTKTVAEGSLLSSEKTVRDAQGQLRTERRPAWQRRHHPTDATHVRQCHRRSNLQHVRSLFAAGRTPNFCRPNHEAYVTS